MRFRFGKCFSSLMYFKRLNIFYSFKFSQSNRKTSLTNEIRLIYYTFFHNEHNDLLTIFETCLNPFIECASSLMRIIGWFLVGFVLILVFNMIYLFYMVILPQILMTTWINFVGHFLIGNWLVINTVFHYLMGLITSPGFPPNTNVKNIVTICKKCILPKPARTHHCSICKRCVLKMDHHCPWFNNCIGFYNHRYFLMFCIFMTLDCSYLSTFGFYYYQSYVYPSMDLNILKLILNTGSLTVSLSNSYYYQLSSVEFFLAFIAGFAVCGLALVNIYIVSHGATNVELKSMKIPCVPSTYSNAKNPYDLGFVTNWKIFLGFDDFKSFVLKVILPSTHKPIGDGIDWTEYFNYQQNNIFARYTILDV